jgi:hypothetical protein
VLADLYAEVQRTMPLRSAIQVVAPGANVALYVNERRVEGMRVAVADGEYRVFVSTLRGDGRIHKLRVAGAETLTIDVPFEVSLETDELVGFSFDDAAQETRDEPRFLQKLGAALGVRDLVVMNTLTLDEHPAVALTLHATDKGSRLARVATPGVAGVVPAAQVGQVARRLAVERLALQGGAAPPTSDQDRAAGLLVMTTRRKSPELIAQQSAVLTAIPCADAPGAPEPTVERAVNAANACYVQGRPELALRKAREIVRRSDDKKAWRILGAAACSTGDREALGSAWKHFAGDDTSRQFLHYVCQRNGRAVP